MLDERLQTRSRAKLQELYFGDSPQAHRFRYGLVIIDLVTIGVFLLASAIPEQWWLVPIDLMLALLLSIEFVARVFATKNRGCHLLSFTTLADLVVLASLLLPAFVGTAKLRFARLLPDFLSTQRRYILREMALIPLNCAEAHLFSLQGGLFVLLSRSSHERPPPWGES